MTYETSLEVEEGFRDLLRDRIDDPNSNRKPGENWIFAGDIEGIDFNLPVVWFTDYSKHTIHHISGETEQQNIYYDIHICSKQRSEVKNILGQLESKVFLDHFECVVTDENEFIRIDTPPKGRRGEGIIYHGIKSVCVQYHHTRSSL